MSDGDQDKPQDGDATTEPEAGEAANPKKIRLKRVTKKLLERGSAEFWQGCFSTEIGRREMWAVLLACHTFEQIFAAGPAGFPDPQANWFHAGEREIGLRLWRTWLARDPKAVIAMHLENDEGLQRFRAAEDAVT